MRDGFRTSENSVHGSALNGANAGASTEPQWWSSRSAEGYVFAISTAPFSPKCHPLSEKSKSSASGAGIARWCSGMSRESPGAQAPVGYSVMRGPLTTPRPVRSSSIGYTCLT